MKHAPPRSPGALGLRSAAGQPGGREHLAFVVQRLVEVFGDMKVTSSPWYLWPFVALWRFLTWILGLTGRVVAVVLGLALMIVGVIVSLTVVGAVVGVPLLIFGLLLILRGLF